MPCRLTTYDSVDKPWAPPIVTEPDMRFRIDAFAPSPLMSVEEHIQKDQYMVEIYTAVKKTWPTPEDVVNDVEIATTILSLIILTTCRKIRLKEQWVDVRNLRLFAEQKIVREKVASAVRWKRFAVLRTLRELFECIFHACMLMSNYRPLVRRVYHLILILTPDSDVMRYVLYLVVPLPYGRLLYLIE